MSDKRGRKRRSKRVPGIAAACVLAVVVLGAAVFLYHPPSNTNNPVATSSSSIPKYIILYVNQGNGVVNEGNFGSMLSFASSQGFNTLFFQVYREGVLLFDSSELGVFVTQAHADHIKIFFSLYITNSSQQIPASVYPLGEDGIGLDMSTLTVPQQSAVFVSLQQGYSSGLTAITTTDLTLPLSPNLLVLETYSSDVQQYSQYIRPGVIGSVGVFATTSGSNYRQEFQYVVSNSDGVMVFDYAGLMKSGY